MTEPEPPSRLNPLNPMTDIEKAVYELVGQGLTLKQVHAEMVARGFAMAERTVEARIRDVAQKVPNPHRLTPMSAIKAAYGDQNRAA